MYIFLGNILLLPNLFLSTQIEVKCLEARMLIELDA